MFSEYEHMQNHYNYINLLETDNEFQWVVTEKIHGSNYSIIYDGTDILSCKRTSILKQEDKFFNYKNVTLKYTEDTKKIYEYLLKIYPSLIQIQIYGELFGGRYNNETTKNYSAIQNGMNYHPHHEFMFYDILITTHGKTHYMSKSDMLQMMNNIKLELKMVPVILISNLENIMKLNPKFETLVPGKYNLPHMQNNYAEGYVIHPYGEYEGTRKIFKFKNPSFAEIGFGVKKEKTPKFSDTVLQYITEHRYENVLSKLLETERTEDIIINALCQDIKLELETENNINNINNNTNNTCNINNDALKGCVTSYIKKKFIINTPTDTPITVGINLLEFLNSLITDKIDKIDKIDEIKRFKIDKTILSTITIDNEIINKFSDDEKIKYAQYTEKQNNINVNMINYLIYKSNANPDEPNIYKLSFDNKIKLYKITKDKKNKVCCCKIHSTDICKCGLELFVAQTEQLNYTSCGKWKKSFYFHNKTDLFNYILSDDNEYKINYKFVEQTSENYMLYLDLDFKTVGENFQYTNEIIQEILLILSECITNNLQYIYSDKNIGNGVHLYFPNIITNTKIHRQILTHLKSKISNVEHSCIIDIQAFSGLSVMFQTETYYKINFEKSTYDIEDKSQLDQLNITSIRTNSVGPNIEFINNNEQL